MTDLCHPTSPSLEDSGLDATGANAILNIGSWMTQGAPVCAPAAANYNRAIDARREEH